MKKTIEELMEILEECKSSSWDGKCRLVDDSDKVEADGCYWGIVNDHGNVEICHRGGNRLIYDGGLV